MMKKQPIESNTTTCDICKQEKEVNVHCTYIVANDNDSLVEVVCQYVCDDCAPIVNEMQSYYNGLMS